MVCKIKCKRIEQGSDFAHCTYCNMHNIHNLYNDMLKYAKRYAVICKIIFKRIVQGSDFAYYADCNMQNMQIVCIFCIYRFIFCIPSWILYIYLVSYSGILCICCYLLCMFLFISGTLLHIFPGWFLHCSTRSNCLVWGGPGVEAFMYSRNKRGAGLGQKQMNKSWLGKDPSAAACAQGIASRSSRVSLTNLSMGESER